MLIARRFHIRRSPVPIPTLLFDSISGPDFRTSRAPLIKRRFTVGTAADPYTLKTIGGFDTFVLQPNRRFPGKSIVFLVDFQSLALPAVAGLAERCAENGFTCYIPVLDQRSLRIPPWLQRILRRNDPDFQMNGLLLQCYIFVAGGLRLLRFTRALRNIPGTTSVGMVGLGHFSYHAAAAAFMPPRKGLTPDATFLCTPDFGVPEAAAWCLRSYKVPVCVMTNKERKPSGVEERHSYPALKFHMVDAAEPDEQAAALDGFWGLPARDIEQAVVRWFKEHL
ncbi:uncharacterized protein BKCO1_19000187 [Diplodia corticola]|uniref:Dienelactone hydrolase n=1 Tax=Diplodia corticola TaxID=236234 RepID=A0A1J9S5A7_9PEZI|nr:uncharacterized protein BKCO1_19000187 [Diplodia corticola]OJD35132.1 hypothetical protein BKCO1_19000187 [Diplodia corticola]